MCPDDLRMLREAGREAQWLRDLRSDCCLAFLHLEDACGVFSSVAAGLCCGRRWLQVSESAWLAFQGTEHTRKHPRIPGSSQEPPLCARTGFQSGDSAAQLKTEGISVLSHSLPFPPKVLLKHLNSRPVISVAGL